jgi:HEPN domain-containing protein
MKRLVAEWVAKAEGDFATLQRELRARAKPNYDSACFHAQQCAEKYLKARLCQAGQTFVKIHDLVALLEQALAAEPSWDGYREDLAFLSAFAVAFRYPGEAADKESARDAARRCRKFRKAARAGLGLPQT